MLGLVTPFEAADAFFDQAQAFIDRRNGAKLDFDRASPVVESPKNLGLHVAQLLDELIANPVIWPRISVIRSAELVNVLFGGRAGIFRHALSLRVCLILSRLTLANDVFVLSRIESPGLRDFHCIAVKPFVRRAGCRRRFCPRISLTN